MSVTFSDDVSERPVAIDGAGVLGRRNYFNNLSVKRFTDAGTKRI